MKNQELEFGVVKYAREHPVKGFTLLLDEAAFFRCDRCGVSLNLAKWPKPDDPRPIHAHWHAQMGDAL